MKLPGEVQRDGLLLTTWVRGNENPHPASTPCRGAGAGPIQVKIERIRVLDSHAPTDGDPAELETVGGLVRRHHPGFRRSDHATGMSGSVVREGALAPASAVPEPLKLCVPRGPSATFAVSGGDDDKDTGNPWDDLDFDDIGDDDDDLLVGGQRRFEGRLPTGLQHMRSRDLEITYRVRRAPANATVSSSRRQAQVAPG